VIDLSSFSDEDDLIAATSCDFEFTQRLFGEHNRAVLGLPGDGKITILSDSEKEEVHEEKTTNTKDATASAAVNSASTTSADANDALVGENDNSDDQGPDQEVGSDDSSGDDIGEP
jgi:hypothetical protein